MQRTNRIPRIAAMLFVLFILVDLTGCRHEDDPLPDPTVPTSNKQVQVQVAYDATDVAFRFTWKTQKKLFPAGQANTGQQYPMQFHDVLKHNGTAFNRLPSGERLEEDRVSLMISETVGGITAFGIAGCAITCHDGMASHNLPNPEVLDHWHWRGARSGPMGYAEDAAVTDVERIRDNLGTPPSKFLRSSGDRLREDQAAMSGTTHPVLTDGLPRFVFNKGKVMAGNFTIPSYFLTNQDNNIITDPYTGIPPVKNLTNNRSLIVAYQETAFDPIDKVNALDLGYLVFVATGEVAHLPAHMSDSSSADFISWRNYMAGQSSISTAAAALNKLNDVHAAWVGSGRSAMVGRGIGFIYASDQHDITSERSYNSSTNEWTVVLRRKLSTGSTRDADLAGIPTGTKYTFAFAMHDSGSGSETHDIAIPVTLSKEASGSDMQAKSVTSLNSINWSQVPVYETNWVKQEHLANYTWDWLTGPAHLGAGAVTSLTCVSCHNGEKELRTSGIITN